MSGIVNSMLEQARGASPLQVAAEGFKEALDEWPTSSPNIPAVDVLAAFANPIKGSAIDAKPSLTATSSTSAEPRIKHKIGKRYKELAKAEVVVNPDDDISAFSPCKHGNYPPSCKFAKFDKTRRQKWCK